jgi:hypothetical protein
MSWVSVAIATVSTGVSVYSGVESKRIRAGQALQSAKLALIDRSLMDTQTKQSAIIRMNQFENDMSANENMFANLGRADDPSMQAFFDNQKDIVATDIRLATNQSLIEMRKTEIEAASLRAGAKNALRSATVNAFGDIMGGISSYQSSKKKSDK